MSSALAKQEKQERAGKEDRASKSVRLNVGKVTNTLEALEQHGVDIPGNSLDRKQSVLIPGFLGYFRNVDIAKIENGMETREVKGSSQERECCWQA